MSVSPVLDDLDRALLARLGSDARTPVSALATTLGVARGTVQTRITRLLDGGVIRRFTVELDPTVDELDTLKQLEMGKLVSTPQAIKEHLSGRLFERGYIAKNASDQLTITDTGRALIRRQDN